MWLNRWQHIISMDKCQNLSFHRKSCIYFSWLYELYKVQLIQNSMQCFIGVGGQNGKKWQKEQVKGFLLMFRFWLPIKGSYFSDFVCVLSVVQRVEVAAMLGRLRQQRMLMVQTVCQYKFVYQVLVQFLKHSRLIWALSFPDNNPTNNLHLSISHASICLSFFGSVYEMFTINVT